MSKVKVKYTSILIQILAEEDKVNDPGEYELSMNVDSLIGDTESFVSDMSVKYPEFDIKFMEIEE